MKFGPLLFAVVLLTAAQAACFNVPDSLKSLFADRVVLPVEGVWQLNDQAVMMIEADDTRSLTVTLLMSPDPAVETPVVIGYGRPGGNAREYALSLAGDIGSNGSGLKKKTRFAASVESDGRLILKPVSDGVKFRVNLWHALPYLGRISLTREKQHDDLAGAWRLFPLTPDPLNPVIL